MADHKFTVRRKEPGLSYEAVEEGTGHVIPLITHAPIGGFPDIETHLSGHHGISLASPGLVYNTILGDTHIGQTWTYVRGPETVIVVDQPRTVFEFTIFPPEP